MREVKQYTGVSLLPRQREKLRHLATQLGSSPNAIVGMLVDNAVVGEVVRREAVTYLPANANSDGIRQDTPVAAAV